MLQAHAKVIRFVILATQVTGRKKFQKMIYIAKKMGFPFVEKYELRMYGPYSEELTLRIEELCEMGFLSEARVEKASYSQYQYIATNEGKRFVKSSGNADELLEGIIDLMQVKSSRFLELVSTLLYFDYLTKEEQIKKVHIVKNKLEISDAEIEDAFNFILQLELKSAP